MCINSLCESLNTNGQILYVNCKNNRSRYKVDFFTKWWRVESDCTYFHGQRSTEPAMTLVWTRVQNGGGPLEEHRKGGSKLNEYRTFPPSGMFPTLSRRTARDDSRVHRSSLGTRPAYHRRVGPSTPPPWSWPTTPFTSVAYVRNHITITPKYFLRTWRAKHFDKRLGVNYQVKQLYSRVISTEYLSI